MAIYVNADGLRIPYGTSEGKNAGAGEYSLTGPQHMTELTIELADVPSSAGIISSGVHLPAGVLIEKIHTLVTVETAGVNANLDLGLGYQHATTFAQTELDYNGLLAAADVFNSGTDVGASTTMFNEFLPGGTEAGALVGTTLATTNPRYLVTANYDTAAFTAGTLVVRIFWSKTPTKTTVIPG
jgi:hypothetical protein